MENLGQILARAMFVLGYIVIVLLIPDDKDDKVKEITNNFIIRLAIATAIMHGISTIIFSFIINHTFIALLIAIFLLVLAYGIFKKSRICAIILLIAWTVELYGKTLLGKSLLGFHTIYTTIVYIAGMIAIFRHHIIYKKQH